jgi:hypothetical protein
MGGILIALLEGSGGRDFANPFLTFNPWGALIDAKLEEE